MADRKDIAAAREAVTGFLDGLREGGTGKWREFVQLTFREGKVAPAIPGFRRFEIVSVRTEGKAQKKATVRLLLNPTGSWGLRWQKGTLNVIAETEPYKADPEGEWGVCPASWRPDGRPEMLR